MNFKEYDEIIKNHKMGFIGGMLWVKHIVI